MKNARCRTRRRLVILMMVIGMLTGCASMFQSLDERMGRKRFKSDYEALDKAMTSYDAGEYAKALHRFKALATESASETIARRARLGEICCRLLTAETEAAYTGAIGLWHEFGESAVDADSGWTLTLLDPLIVRGVPAPPQPATTPIPDDPPPAEAAAPVAVKPPVVKQDDRRLQAELDAMKKKAKQVDHLQEQLDQIAAENRSLKEKIKALEAIDQSIQKKKTEISTPSE